MVEYTDGTDYDGIWKLLHDDKVKVGDTVDFSSGDKQSSRTYGIQATIAPSKLKPSYTYFQVSFLRTSFSLKMGLRLIHGMFPLPFS